MKEKMKEKMRDKMREEKKQREKTRDEAREREGREVTFHLELHITNILPFYYKTIPSLHAKLFVC